MALVVCVLKQAGMPHERLFRIDDVNSDQNMIGICQMQYCLNENRQPIGILTDKWVKGFVYAVPISDGRFLLPDNEIYELPDALVIRANP